MKWSPILIAPVLAACASGSIALPLGSSRTTLQPPFVRPRPDGGYLLLDREGTLLRFTPEGRPLPTIRLDRYGIPLQPSFVHETPEGLFYATVPSETGTSLMKFDTDGSFLQTVATVEGTALTLVASQERGLILATSLSTDAVRIHIFVDDLLIRSRTFQPEGESDIASVHLLSRGGIVLIEHEAADRPRLIAWDPRTDRSTPFPLPHLRNPVFAGILSPDRPVLVEPVKSRLLRIHILGPDGAVFHSFPRRIRPLTLQGRLLDPAFPVGEHLFELRLSPHRLRLIPIL